MTKEKRVPVIGIPGALVSSNGFGVTLPYLEFFNQYGDIRILTLSSTVDPEIDLLVIPGGADVNPSRYNAPPDFSTSKPDLIKEYFDTRILPMYITHGTPVFGICRGIQTIAVLFGAKLIQHITNHETNHANNRVAGVHDIVILKKDFIEQLQIENNILSVNSMHHQCVSAIDLPNTLEVVAIYAGKKGKPSIEALTHRTLPVMAVQYHPEELGFDVLSDYMILTLISKSKNYEA